jgi:hypothetical protein
MIAHIKILLQHNISRKVSKYYSSTLAYYLPYIRMLLQHNISWKVSKYSYSTIAYPHIKILLSQDHIDHCQDIIALSIMENCAIE